MTPARNSAPSDVPVTAEYRIIGELGGATGLGSSLRFGLGGFVPAGRLPADRSCHRAHVPPSRPIRSLPGLTNGSARIPHSPPVADADALALTGHASSIHFDMASTMPRRSKVRITVRTVDALTVRKFARGNK